MINEGEIYFLDETNQYAVITGPRNQKDKLIGVVFTQDKELKNITGYKYIEIDSLINISAVSKLEEYEIKLLKDRVLSMVSRETELLKA